MPRTGSMCDFPWCLLVNTIIGDRARASATIPLHEKLRSRGNERCARNRGRAGKGDIAAHFRTRALNRNVTSTSALTMEEIEKIKREARGSAPRYACEPALCLCRVTGDFETVSRFPGTRAVSCVCTQPRSTACRCKRSPLSHARFMFLGLCLLPVQHARASDCCSQHCSTQQNRHPQNAPAFLHTCKTQTHALLHTHVRGTQPSIDARSRRRPNSSARPSPRRTMTRSPLRR